MSFLQKIFGDPNQKEIKRLEPLVAAINKLEPELEKLSNAEIKQKSQDLRKKILESDSADRADQILNHSLPEAYAVVREAAKRTLGLRHFDVQLIGGIVLHEGKIAEMKTGEGKTLVATLPLYLNSLTGKGVHLVTPNDYLAKIGAHWMGPVYDLLGVSVGVIGQQGQSWRYSTQGTGDRLQETEENLKSNEDWPNLVPCTRQEAYSCDIIYGTNNEFGFDYLRDNLVLSSAQLAQRELNFAIVDEVDSILIDEARTPLIISAAAEESADLYNRFAEFVKNLRENEDYSVDEKERFVKILDSGIKKMEQVLGIENIFDNKTVAYVHHLEEALKAKALFARDKDYVVKDDEVVIVDEFTGRLMPGRRYSEGLHQAIEAKEGVEVKQESKTLATITFQNLFRMYGKLAGMTGTAATEAEEFAKIYNLDVVEIPTHRTVERVDFDDVIYKNQEIKFSAITEVVKEKVAKGQPVLIGTVSVEKSEALSKHLKKFGIKHDILNAKNHEREAKIIKHAGEPGRVTVATNMAGRGVDILLGGEKPGDDATKEEVKDWEARHQLVIEVGGLAVLGTERHESRRIDNQLRGRSGRQGDPGESQFFVSLDDDLMRIFGGGQLRSLMDRLGLPDNEPIHHKLITGAIEQAQKKVESHNFDIRKHLVEYDDVINQHREVVYRKRRKILSMDPAKEVWLHDEILDLLEEEEVDRFNEKVKTVEEDRFRQIERLVYLQTIDTLWTQHLSTIEHLRTGIGLKGYAQKNPLVEYKESAYELFQGFRADVENHVVEMLLKLEIQASPEARSMNQESRDVILSLPAGKAGDSEGSKADFGVRGKEHGVGYDEQKSEEKAPHSPFPTPHSGITLTVRGPGGKQSTETVRSSGGAYGKVGRNDPCPCGSGKKFKKCHGK